MAMDVRTTADSAKRRAGGRAASAHAARRKPVQIAHGSSSPPPLADGVQMGPGHMRNFTPESKYYQAFG